MGKKTTELESGVPDLGSLVDVVISGVSRQSTVEDLLRGTGNANLLSALESAGIAVIRKRTTILTDAEILTLPTTSIEVIPAPGIGKINFPMGAMLDMRQTVPYENVDADADLSIKLPGMSGVYLGPIQNDATAGLSFTTGFFANPRRAHLHLGSHPDTNFEVNYDGADFVAAGVDEDMPTSLVLNNLASGDLTGGDPGNSLIVTVFYNIIDLGS